MSVQQGRRIAGVMVMLLGVALIGYGAHYLIENGTCSSTGYASVGPVPTCGGGQGLDTMAVFFLGPALAVAGWRLGRLWGALWPTTCIALGMGLVTIRVGQSATEVAKAFGPVAGTCFLGLALVSVFTIVGKRLRARSSPAGTYVRPANPPGLRTTLAVDTPASHAPAPTAPLSRTRTSNTRRPPSSPRGSTALPALVLARTPAGDADGGHE